MSEEKKLKPNRDKDGNRLVVASKRLKNMYRRLKDKKSFRVYVRDLSETNDEDPGEWADKWLENKGLKS